MRSADQFCAAPDTQAPVTIKGPKKHDVQLRPLARLVRSSCPIPCPELTVTEPQATLSELIEALNDGSALFARATENSHDARHIALFQRIVRLKQIIAADLKAEVALNGGDPSIEGSWLGSIRQGYVELTAKLISNPQLGYIEALEAQEDRILGAFRDAASDVRRTRVRALAETYLPEIQQMHDSLRALQVRARSGQEPLVVES